MLSANQQHCWKLQAQIETADWAGAFGAIIIWLFLISIYY